MPAIPQFPGYQTDGLLYSGATTRVWKVKQGRNRYALKEYLGAGPILRELASLTELRDPHIVQCLDAGLSLAGGAFLVFELAPGGSLRDKLTHSALSRTEWLRLARHLLSGLAAAHARGLVHCDLKPENVLLFGARRNHYKLADLGLAFRPGESRASLPARGTPAYMAPEQFDGQVTPRSDLYSLGLLLYEAGCGRPPFQGSYAQLREQQQQVSLDLSQWPLEAWRPWLQRLLQKCPEGRPVSALQALDELGPTRPLRLPERGGGAAPASLPLQPGGQCVPVFRMPLEHCSGLNFLSQGGELQLWASLPGLSLVLAHQSERWTGLPAGPRMAACSTSDQVWIADGGAVSLLEPHHTRPRRVLHLSYPVEQLLEVSSLLVVAGSRRLAAYSQDGSRRWTVCLPHYWGPLPLAAWDERSLAVAVGPSPARLLRLAVADGRIEQEIDLPVPCLALLPQGQDLSLILAELRHFASGYTGCWQLRGQQLQRLTALPSDLSWARAHPRGFSLGKSNRATALLDGRGRVLAQVPSVGQVCSDCWSRDGCHYAWTEQHQGLGALRIAQILPSLKEAC